MTEDERGRGAVPVVLALALGVLVTLPGTGEAPHCPVYIDGRQEGD